MSERINLTDKERDAVLREAGYMCAVPGCGTTLAIDVHHIVEVSKGGGNVLTNLLALCPNHHALYHRGYLSGESIQAWKARLTALNRIVDIPLQVRAQVQEAIEAERRSRANSSQRTGFALAAAEFTWRTCAVGILYGDGKILDIGFCCFVGSKIAVTTSEVVDWSAEIAKDRNGHPVVHTRRGMAKFTVKERFDGAGGTVLIEIDEIDDSHMTRILANHGKEVEQFFAEPLQTPVRARIAPFVGEKVGFLHATENTAVHRASIDCQFDSGDVAFNLKLTGKEDFLQYVLTPVISRVRDRGSPAFTEDGVLVGVIKDSILIEGEQFHRPIVAGAIAVEALNSGKLQKT